MRRHRPTLIYRGLAVLGTAVWTVLAIALPLGVWWIAAGLLATFVGADRGEQAISRRLDRPKPARRQAHARPRPAQTERTRA